MNTRTSTVSTMPMSIVSDRPEPTVSLMARSSSAPLNCAIMTCAPIAMPAPMEKNSCVTNPPVLTADRPAEPTNWPTTIMSTTL